MHAYLCPTLCDSMDCSPRTPLSMEFSGQEYWSGLLFHPPGVLPNPRIEPVSPALAGSFFTTEPPGKPCYLWQITKKWFLYFFLIELYAIYYVVLLSSIQQSDSVIHVCMGVFSFRCFSIVGYYMILNIVPSAIQ